MRARFTCALLFFLLPSLHGQEGQFIRSLQVRGSGRVVELEAHAGQTFERARLTRDLRRLWQTGFFDDIRVEANETPEGVEVIFTVVEKPRLYLRRIQFEPKNEKRPIALEPGTPVDKALAHQLAGALRQRFIEDGYAEAAVSAELVPAGVKQVDLLFRVARGPRTIVGDVRFTGTLALSEKELRRALQATRTRRLLALWPVRPPWNEAALPSDLDRLRSLYLARGYFDARVTLAGVAFAQHAATLTIAVDSGPRYRVEQLALSPDGRMSLRAGRDWSFPARALCDCLLDAQRAAERAGQLDFAARLEIQTPSRLPQAAAQTGHWASLTVRTETGPAFSLGRIEFTGHHAFGDLTLRRALTLAEGERLDASRLRQSLARLNRLGFFEPLTEDKVELLRHAQSDRVDMVIHLKERPRGRWALSGPLGPFAVAGPLQFSLGARLPAWGSGALELSTYSATFSLLAFSYPVIRALSIVPERRYLPLFALERPDLPGQEWQSGFLLSPQIGWRGTLASYALSHASHAAHNLLEPKTDGAVSLPVSVWWRGQGTEPALKPAGVLLCEAEKPRRAWLRTAGLAALDFLLFARVL